MKDTISSQSLAPSITKAASNQTYYMIRFLADHERMADTNRAYAYFRWVDDKSGDLFATVEKTMSDLGAESIGL